MKLPSFTLILSAALSLAAHADNTNLTSELKVSSVVKQADGSEALAQAQAVKPGDVLQYSTVYTNPSQRPVSRLVTNLPIPVGTELIAAGTVPSAVLASLDGKVFAPAPLMRKLRRADGQLVDVPVPLNEYRSLRWPEQQLAAGGSFTTTARVRVISAPSVATPSAATTGPR